MLENRGRIVAGSAQGRSESEEDAGQDRDGDGERENARVRREIVGDRDFPVAGHEIDKEVAAPTGKGEAEGGASQRENETFGEDLLCEGPGTGTDGNADAEFVAAGGGASEHKVGEIDASEKQNEADDGSEDVERANEIEAEARGEALSSGSDCQARGQEWRRW